MGVGSTAAWGQCTHPLGQLTTQADPEATVAVGSLPQPVAGVTKVIAELSHPGSCLG